MMGVACQTQVNSIHRNEPLMIWELAKFMGTLLKNIARGAVERMCFFCFLEGRGGRKGGRGELRKRGQS